MRGGTRSPYYSAPGAYFPVGELRSGTRAVPTDDLQTFTLRQFKHISAGPGHPSERSQSHGEKRAVHVPLIGRIPSVRSLTLENSPVGASRAEPRETASSCELETPHGVSSLSLGEHRREQIRRHPDQGRIEAPVTARACSSRQLQRIEVAHSDRCKTILPSDSMRATSCNATSSGSQSDTPRTGDSLRFEHVSIPRA
jgi:hypothetical protein